jgi:ABC-type multidrug transport system fused ATPase/permease subunit
MGKSLILLDEVTSNVDGVNEELIYQSIAREFAGKTIIASIHGLHLLGHFDRIVMFDEGRIVASGTLDEMMATCPQFVRLLRHYEKRRAQEVQDSEE